jgi:hypothetical protein
MELWPTSDYGRALTIQYSHIGRYLGSIDEIEETNQIVAASGATRSTLVC